MMWRTHGSPRRVQPGSPCAGLRPPWPPRPPPALAVGPASQPLPATPPPHHHLPKISAFSSPCAKVIHGSYCPAAIALSLQEPQFLQDRHPLYVGHDVFARERDCVPL
ncbi:hypothetical protein ONE63_002083 [Megalurothrips usitatus]|uniref:Uncharacterized protein n=1 Tax=Megalurothrips usitatus TaxID=439358 RepID=A0AAV7XH74_9NEOP|nr:hypothetical protein ONE63_002083 [Megalurothrips usitatus]